MGNYTVQSQVGTTTYMNVTVANGLTGGYNCSFTNTNDQSVHFIESLRSE